MCRNVDWAQDSLQRKILIENPSTYFDNSKSELLETDFLSQVTKRTGVQILLDATNIYVSGKNDGFEVEKYIEAIEPSLVAEVHLAGHPEERVDDKH